MSLSIAHKLGQQASALLRQQKSAAVILPNIFKSGENRRSYHNAQGSLIPIVIEQTGRGERAYDIYSRSQCYTTGLSWSLSVGWNKPECLSQANF
jgi:hypothetical protein